MFGTTVASAQSAVAPVQDALLAAAAVDARANFGVANLMDDLLFPVSDGRPGGFAMDSVVVPGVFDYTDLACDGGPCQRPIDAMAGSIGLAANSRYVGVYYASSLNFVLERNELSPATLPFLAIGAPLTTPLAAPMFVGPTRFIDDSDVGAVFSGGLEYSLGARVFVPTGDSVLAGSVGYYAAGDRQGLYTTFDQSELHLAFRALLTAGVPYLLAGLHHSSFLWDGVGRLGANKLASSLFVRKLSLAPADSLFGQPSDLAASAPPLWTGHLEQYNLGPLDLKFAAAFRPVLLVHEATATLHRGDAEHTLCSVTGGVVGLPDAPWIGADGGVYPTAEAGCDVLSASLSIHAGLNTADVLTAFPYSRNAVIARMTIAFGSDEDGNLVGRSQE